MELKFLGTGAAEGIPSLFCECELCRRAEMLGGKEIRTRAGALINNKILMDLTPDIYYHKLRYGLNLAGIAGAVITHSHTDHFDSAELTRRSAGHYCQRKDEHPFIVYGNEKVYRLGRESLKLEFGVPEDDSIVFRTIQPYDHWEFEGVRFTAIPACHDPEEDCMLYILQDENSCILYGNDTGLLPKETFDAMKGYVFDMVSLDCTFGNRSFVAAGHMGYAENAIFLKELKKRGCLKETTTVISTHFSHNAGMLQEELEEAGQKIGIIAAYDGFVWKNRL